MFYRSEQLSVDCPFVSLPFIVLTQIHVSVLKSMYVNDTALVRFGPSL